MVGKDITPSLVIGLGGTGQWVLTYLKKNLLERWGEIPPTIRLLAFDTTNDVSEAQKDVVAEESASVGGVCLGLGEFVYLDGNMKRICEEAREGRHAYIREWLQVDAYLGGKDNQIGLSYDDFNLARGAGMRRPFGRMAVFYDLAQANQSKVRGKIHDALQGVVSSLKKARPVEIYIVCSPAGGTGSGMFLDIAHLVRLIAQEQVRTEVALRGFLVLHNTFQSVIKVDHVMANTFAAFRELNRFMTLFGESNAIDYTDDPNQRALHAVHNGKPFDSCFILDGERAQRSLRGVNPKYGVYPSVADIISMLLDPDTGDTFRQHYTNVNNSVATVQKRNSVALYSSLGTYSYILPVNDMIQACTLRFATEFLERCFAQLSAFDSRTGRKETGLPALALDDIAKDAKGFLKQGASPSGTQNTSFVQAVALKIGRNVEEPRYIQEVASAGLELLDMLQSSGNDLTALSLNRRLDRLKTVRLTDEIKTGEEIKDSFESAAARMLWQIESFKHRYLGELSATTGKRSGGELSHVFEASADTNLQRFKEYLRERLESIFSDTATPGIRSSQLGYAQAFLGQILKAFEDFAGLIERAHQQHNRAGELAYAREDADRARKQLEITKNETNVVDRVVRKSEVIAQKRFVTAEQYLVDLELEELVFSELIRVSQSHRNIVQELLADVSHWVNIWVNGDLARNEPSVTRIVKDATLRLEQQREETALVAVRQYVTDPAYENRLYLQLTDGKFEHLLARFKWTCAALNGHLSIELWLDGKPLLKDWRAQSVAALSYEALVQAVRPYFSDIERETLVTRLEQLYGHKVDMVANNLLDLSAPPLAIDREDEATSDVESQIFVSIHSHEAIDFVNTVENQLKRRARNIKDAQILLASDPYRCVVFSTTDFISTTSVRLLQEARKAYGNMRTGRTLLHVFPAEVHAVRYEERMADKPFYELPRQFTPRVISLLENEAKFKLFVLAFAVGVIRIEGCPDKNGRQQYMLRVLREDRFDQSFEVALSVPSSRPSLCDAVYTFVFQRPNRPGEGTEDLIVSTDGRIFVTLKRVDEAIALRMKIFQQGREKQVEEFGRSVRLCPEAELCNLVLEDEFSRFLDSNAHNLPVPAEADLEKLTQQVQLWLKENRDLVPNQFHAEILAHTIRILLNVAPDEGTGNLQRRMENFIGQTVPLFKNGINQDERDLGTLMHMIAWDYLQALEGK